MQTSLPLTLSSLTSAHPVSNSSQLQHHVDYTRANNDHPTSSLPSPPPKAPIRNPKRHSNATTKSQKAAQLAKQELRSKIREDWAWPPESGSLCSYQALNLPSAGSEWRERGEGFDTDASPTETVPINPYQYENADAVRAAITAPRSVESKKRKRRKALLEEMDWNEGLRHFVVRRDVWSGARMLPPSPPSMAICGLISDAGASERRSSVTGEMSVRAQREAIYTHPAANGFTSEPVHQPLDLPISFPSSQQAPEITLVPLPPPILPPDNAVRASITPATHPSIYSKIVIQGLTPTVPINLHDVVGSLVKGWKDSGEWPPKSEAEKVAIEGGVGSFDGLGESTSNGMRDGVRKRIGKVKRALRLSGPVEDYDDLETEVGVDEAPRDTNNCDG